MPFSIGSSWWRAGDEKAGMPSDPGEAAPGLRLGCFPDRWLQRVESPAPASPPRADRARAVSTLVTLAVHSGQRSTIGENRPHPLRGAAISTAMLNSVMPP